jgi:hypothetical protein
LAMSKQMNDITRGLGLPHGVNDEFGAYWIGIMTHDYSHSRTTEF